MEGLEHFGEGRADRGQLLHVGRRQDAQLLLTFQRQADQHAPAIDGVGFAGDQAEFAKPVGELDSAVMAQLQDVRQFANRQNALLRQAAYGQERLMLLTCQPGRGRGVLAEGKELAQLMPKLRQCLVVAPVHRRAAFF